MIIVAIDSLKDHFWKNLYDCILNPILNCSRYYIGEGFIIFVVPFVIFWLKLYDLCQLVWQKIHDLLALYKSVSDLSNLIGWSHVVELNVGFWLATLIVLPMASPNRKCLVTPLVGLAKLCIVIQYTPVVSHPTLCSGL